MAYLREETVSFCTATFSENPNVLKLKRPYSHDAHYHMFLHSIIIFSSSSILFLRFNVNSRTWLVLFLSWFKSNERPSCFSKFHTQLSRFPSRLFVCAQYLSHFLWHNFILFLFFSFLVAACIVISADHNSHSTLWCAQARTSCGVK